MTQAPAFSLFREQFLESFYRHRPVDATFIGHHDHDDQLPDASEDGRRSTSLEIDALVSTMDRLPTETLDAAEATDKKLIRGALILARNELTRLHENPSWATGEAIFGMFSLLLTDFAPETDRLERLRSRLDKVSSFLDHARRNIDGRSAPPPGPWLSRSMNECVGALAFFSEGLAHLSPRPPLQASAARAAEAFSTFHDYLESQAVPEDSPVNVTDVAVGEERFTEILELGHQLDWSPSELASRAERELDRCAQRLNDASKSWREDLTKLEELHPSRETYLDAFHSCWTKSHELARSANLLTWPDYPIDYVPRPSWARAAAPHLYFLFYRSPAPLDGAERVRYLVPPLEPELGDVEASSLLRSMNDSVIKLNHVVHHGGIGHHVQNWYAQRSESRIGRIAAVDGASRIAMTCGGTMAEGWACYATDLMDEAGFLTPLESLSQHHAHARMAARAVVDARLHCEEISFAEAVRFYVERTNMSESAARAEVTKNSMFPGAGVIYFVGASLLHDLRRTVSEREGAQFDLRSFHDRVLSHGSIPVELIRQSMLETSP